ncbi:MAG: hypothetical protein AB1798_24160 [Spirochaetota bacterium]
MEAQNPALEGLSIVLLGDFNPKIFQPAWFAAEELIRKRESEEAKIEIINPEIVIFSLDWARLEIIRNRFTISTNQEPYYESLRDLVIGTFKLLRHTPIGKMGINIEMHFRMKSEEEWHTFGHKLAPKEIWNEILENPGLRSLTMEGNVRGDSLKGYIRVKVEPSPRFHPGILFKVNDHYEIKAPNTAMGADEIINTLENSWKESLKRSKGIINSLLEAS